MTPYESNNGGIPSLHSLDCAKPLECCTSSKGFLYVQPFPSRRPSEFPRVSSPATRENSAHTRSEPSEESESSTTINYIGNSNLIAAAHVKFNLKNLQSNHSSNTSNKIQQRMSVDNYLANNMNKNKYPYSSTKSESDMTHDYKSTIEKSRQTLIEPTSIPDIIDVTDKTHEENTNFEVMKTENPKINLMINNKYDKKQNLLNEKISTARQNTTESSNPTTDNNKKSLKCMSENIDKTVTTIKTESRDVATTKQATFSNQNFKNITTERISIQTSTKPTKEIHENITNSNINIIEKPTEILKNKTVSSSTIKPKVESTTLLLDNENRHLSITPISTKNTSEITTTKLETVSSSSVEPIIKSTTSVTKINNFSTTDSKIQVIEKTTESSVDVIQEPYVASPTIKSMSL